MLGWYAYAFAAEPFVVSAVATYVPLLMESLARDNAVLASDHRTPCRVPGDVPGLLPTPISPPRCVVRLGWTWIDTASLPLYTFAFSVAVQTAVVISISGIADRSLQSRKFLLVGFAVIGALATITMANIRGSHYYIAALMAVVSNASFGAVTVCGNAYIPALVKTEINKLQSDQLAFVNNNGSNRSRRSSNRSSSNRSSSYGGSNYGGSNYGGSNYGSVDVESLNFNRFEVDAKAISSRISGRGAAIGYASALFVQIITMAMLLVDRQDAPNAKLRSVITFIGGWWLFWQIPVVLFLRVDDDVSDGDDDAESNGVVAGIASGWIGLVNTARKATLLRDISIFLLGWFLLSDAVMTINSTAVLFARTNLGMTTPALALIGLITVVFAIAGSLALSRDKSSKSMVLISLIGSTIPLYGVIGFFQPWLGLNHSWELYALASWYGFMLGALNTVTRSMYSLLIPRGHEVMFFALYSVTDKGSSILGPTITGMITDYTHNIRYTFYFLLGMMLLAALTFTHVDYLRGQHDAAELDMLRSTAAAAAATGAGAESDRNDTGQRLEGRYEM